MSPRGRKDGALVRLHIIWAQSNRTLSLFLVIQRCHLGSGWVVTSGRMGVNRKGDCGRVQFNYYVSRIPIRSVDSSTFARLYDCACRTLEADLCNYNPRQVLWGAPRGRSHEETLTLIRNLYQRRSSSSSSSEDTDKCNKYSHVPVVV